MTAKALTPKQRATAKLWADRLIADDKAHARGAPRRYIRPDEQLAKGGRLLDLPCPNGKTLGKSTGLEARIMGEAYLIMAARYEALQAAAQLLASEMAS
jgi:hypothetical protein